MMHSRVWLLVLVMALVLATTAAKPKKKKHRFDRHVKEHTVSKADILENRQRRKRQLEGMILDARQKLADHSAGSIKLDDEEKSDLERRISLFQRKVEDLSKEMDDREWELVLRREHRHAERRRRRHEEL